MSKYTYTTIYRVHIYSSIYFDSFLAGSGLPTVNICIAPLNYYILNFIVIVSGARLLQNKLVQCIIICFCKYLCNSVNIFCLVLLKITDIGIILCKHLSCASLAYDPHSQSPLQYLYLCIILREYVLQIHTFCLTDIEAECQDDFMKIRVGFNGSFSGLVYSAGMFIIKVLSIPYKDLISFRYPQFAWQKLLEGIRSPVVRILINIFVYCSYTYSNVPPIFEFELEFEESERSKIYLNF